MPDMEGYVEHGFIPTEQSGNQLVGTCPFCGKEKHFYVKADATAWDCKRCGRSGGWNKFLESVVGRNQQELTSQDVNRLSANRGLPLKAFDGAGIGIYCSVYTIPVRDGVGRLVDVRRWKPGGKCLATAGCKVGLYGLDRLGQENLVYICEGEWDAMAMNWLLKFLGKPGQALGVPGASTFKAEWSVIFRGRDAIAIYDHDEAGQRGKELCRGRLQGVARSLRFMLWPAGCPTGYDLRDWIRYGCFELKKPRSCFEHLHRNLSTDPHVRGNGAEEIASPKKVMSATEAIDLYRRWLYLDSADPLKIIFGAVYANRLPGDPVWFFIVGPPGSAKSELLMSLGGGDEIEATTALTPHSLISGGYGPGGVDPSLLPRLNGKVLVIKDFTTILSMNHNVRDEIFGILRDAYDGSAKKVFGNGIERSYQSKFGLLAGVTPKVEGFTLEHQALGERFLRYRIGEGNRKHAERAAVARALGNIAQEDAQREGLREAAQGVLARKFQVGPHGSDIPKISEAILEEVYWLSQYCACLRGGVDRERFSQMVQSRPTLEWGTRLAKQLAKLMIGVALFLGHREIGPEELRIARIVAKDTVPDRNEAVVSGLRGRKIDSQALAELIRLPHPTVYRVLCDMQLIGLVKRIKRTGTGVGKGVWTLSESVDEIITRSKVYEG